MPPATRPFAPATRHRSQSVAAARPTERRAGHDPIGDPCRQLRNQTGEDEMAHPVRDRLPRDRVDQAGRRCGVKRLCEDLGVVNVSGPVLGHEPGDRPDRPTTEQQARRRAPENPASLRTTIARQVPARSRRRKARDQPVLNLATRGFRPLSSSGERGAERPVPADDSRDYNPSGGQAPKETSCFRSTRGAC